MKSRMVSNGTDCSAWDGTRPWPIGCQVFRAHCRPVQPWEHKADRFKSIFLRVPIPPTHLGSPRQLDAYDYPKIYGPRSPSFARATLFQSDGTTQLFISGTASVVGHQSQHEGLVDAQALETVTNLRALIERAQCTTPSFQREKRLQSVFKVYLRNPKHLETVRHVLDAPFLLTSRLLYLQGDLCRKELLVEIEGLVTAD